MPPYLKPSQDPTLIEFAKASGTKYLMSTSTISNALMHIYYLASHFQNPSMNSISRVFKDFSQKFMISQRKPVTNILRKVAPGVYAMDSDSNPFNSRIDMLLDLGKVLERMYIMDPDHFNRNLMKAHINPEEHKMLPKEVHRFMVVNGDIGLRSQIDCKTTLSDGSSIAFEIKSRANAAIRYYLEKYFDYLDYNLDRVMGVHSSYEREYYDLIRGAFLKYFFQLKIGRMHGALVSYHNTLTHFGFEYIPLEKMERALFGNTEKSNLMFVLLNKMLTTFLDHVIEAVDAEEFSFLRLGRLTRLLRELHHGPARNLRRVLPRRRLRQL